MDTQLGKEPAFPNDEQNINHNERGIINSFHNGMSKRFYAACAAMQGILANRELQIAIYKDCKSTSQNPKNLQVDEYLISHCYIFADELLKQENVTTY